MSGRVLNEDGAPLAGVRASLVSSRSSAALASVQTDALGRFTLEPEHLGTFVLHLQDQSGQGYFTEWYEDAASAAEATPIVLGPGAQITGIEPRLNRNVPPVASLTATT